MATNYKIQPHNIEAEQAVLGCILIDNQAQIDILALINEEDFYSEAHQQIYKSMIKVYQKSIPVDFVTITDQLEKDGVLEKVGGIDYITFLTNAVPSAANFKHYCEIVKSDSIRRKLIKSGQEIIEDAFDNQDKDKSLQFAEQVIFDISEKESRSSLEHVGKNNGAVKNVIDKFSEIAKDPTVLKGIPTGYTDFDKITNGLQNSDLILLAARPSVGKTAFAMNIIQHVASVEKKKCAVFSLEMGKEQLAQRSLCSLAKVSMSKAMKGEMSAGEWKAIWAAKNLLQDCDIFVDDSSMNTPMDILGKCRRLKREKGLDLVMVDYLQLMNSGNSRESRQNEVSEMSRLLKVMARELNIPVLVLSQLSRAVEKRPDHRPMLSDLRESGAIEQDADIVMFLHKPFMYADTQVSEAEKTVAELIVAKHRNGALDNIKLKWVGENATFRNMDKDSDMAELEKTMPASYGDNNKDEFFSASEIEDNENSLDAYQDAPLDLENANAPDEIVPITDSSLSDIF